MPPIAKPVTISPQDAYQRMHDDVNALMIDVRTYAEHVWVGVPDLSRVTSRDVPLIPFELNPGCPNPAFLDHVKMEVKNPNHAIIVFSRAGGRSRKAALALCEAGFRRVYDMVGGFDGDKNREGHRSSINGWRFAGLPWYQR